VEIGR